MKLPIPEFDDQSPWGTWRPNRLAAAILRFGQAMPGALGPISKAARRPIKYGSAGPIDLKIWGLKLRLMPRGNISEQKLFTSPKQFDPPEMRIMATTLAQGGTFIDIGTNAGVYCFWAHVCSGGKARVLGFEPDPEMLRRVEYNLKTNSITNVSVLPIALSDSDGSATFWVNESQRGTNSLESSKPEDQAKHVQINVKTRTLVGVLAERNISSIDVMKIDVEGHEPPILRHFFANAPLGLWPKILIAEVRHLPQDELAALVPASHFRLLDNTKLNAIWVKRID